MAQTKNLGQVTGISIGSTAPENTLLLWYDTTPSQNLYKIWDASLDSWVPLKQDAIVSLTYAELVTLAEAGLALGNRYRITDLSNTLAVAITSTKVVYVDTVGNIIVDDLGSNKQYHVTQSNLTFDGSTATYDSTNNSLNFDFTVISDDTAITVDDFDLYAVNKAVGAASGGRMRIPIRRILSAIANNALSWNNGLFFNFTAALQANVDVDGGLVSYNKYAAEQASQDLQIQTIANNYGTLYNQVQTLINNATGDTAVYSKQIPTVAAGSRTPLAVGQTLTAILQNFQAYLTAYAGTTGMSLPTGYAKATVRATLDPGTTLQNSFQQLDYRTWDTNGSLLPSNFVVGNNSGTIAANDTLTLALQKLQKQVQLGVFNAEYKIGYIRANISSSSFSVSLYRTLGDPSSLIRTINGTLNISDTTILSSYRIHSYAGSASIAVATLEITLLGIVKLNDDYAGIGYKPSATDPYLFGTSSFGFYVSGNNVYIQAGAYNQAYITTVLFDAQIEGLMLYKEK